MWNQRVVVGKALEALALARGQAADGRCGSDATSPLGAKRVGQFCIYAEPASLAGRAASAFTIAVKAIW